MRYTAAGAEATADSNTDVIVVAERLDIALSRVGGTMTPSTTAVPVLLVNRGNGMEAFRLSASDNRASPPMRFAIDVDADGRYDADRDTLIADATTPMLQPGASLRLLLLGDTDGAFDDASTTIVAQAVTGSGAPGTVFPGQGDGGGDAIVGPTGAQAQVTVSVIGQDAPPALTKTQRVIAPDGSARAVHGAIVSYTLVATFAGEATGARIDDPVPAGTSYIPGTLSLDGVALTDAADGDAGQADGASIGVALGPVAATGTRTIQFNVRIQ